ncbi:MAG: cox cluster protein [Haloarculaceae archaeon]
MDEQPGLSERYRTASPWPLFVAVGLALSEVGIFLGSFPVAVGGLLLFGASVSGILRESGYVSRPWRTFAAIGVVLAILGGIVVLTQANLATLSIRHLVANPSGTGAVGRGLAIVVAGVMMILAGVAAVLAELLP